MLTGKSSCCSFVRYKLKFLRGFMCPKAARRTSTPLQFVQRLQSIVFRHRADAAREALDGGTSGNQTAIGGKALRGANADALKHSRCIFCRLSCPEQESCLVTSRSTASCTRAQQCQTCRTFRTWPGARRRRRHAHPASGIGAERGEGAMSASFVRSATDAMSFRPNAASQRKCSIARMCGSLRAEHFVPMPFNILFARRILHACRSAKRLSVQTSQSPGGFAASDFA